MLGRHFVATKINNNWILVKVNTRRGIVSFRTFGQNVTVRDLIENEQIYGAFIKFCYGYADDNIVKTIQLDSSVADYEKLTASVISVLIGEYYAEKILEEQMAHRRSQNSAT